MKKLILVLLFSTSLFSQESEGVEKSILNAQIGSGLWMNYEVKVAKNITIRPEIGLINGYNYSSENSLQFGMLPDINIEARKYFNLDKRQKAGKDISNNSANFWSLQGRYLPDTFIFKTNDYLESFNLMQLFINWGLKRNLSSKWHYEFGLGIGRNFYLSDEPNTDHNDMVAKIHLRIGIKL